MSILVNRRSRVITQGITGRAGRLHTSLCREYAHGKRNLVAGVNPRKAGESCDGLPVFGTVKEAKAHTGATVSVIYVPPAFAAAAIDEAVDAELDLVICITAGIPVQDMIRTRQRMQGSRTILLGPNCPGVITPGEIMVGIMPGHIHHSGRIGVVSRSGALTHETANLLAVSGLGQSTVLGIGSDPVGGLTHVDVLKLFNDDPGTDAVVIAGDIGGDDEEFCARWIQGHMRKPVVSCFADTIAPQRLSLLQECGMHVTRSPEEMVQLLASLVSPDHLPFD